MLCVHKIVLLEAIRSKGHDRTKIPKWDAPRGVGVKCMRNGDIGSTHCDIHV